MRPSLFTTLYYPWRLWSLRAKLLLPIIGLMLASLLVSTLAFIIGTAQTRDKLLEQQVTTDMRQAHNALTSRATMVATAADLLAKDPKVVEALQTDTESALLTLNGRAVVMRDRFELDLIQIYNHYGEARANLVLSSLYRQSSLLTMVEAQSPVIYPIENRLLLLQRADLPNGLGTVIVGLDLESELRRIVSRDNLAADLGLQVGSTQVSTREALRFDRPNGDSDDQYTWQEPLTLSQTPLTLLVTRPTGDIAQITQAGLLVMVGSTVMTTLLLLGIGFVVTRAITQPVHRLALAAQGLARGDLSHQIEEVTIPQPFNIGSQDELGLLTQAFNNMVVELRGLYHNLEGKVQARTKQVAAAANVARATSASLELEVILRASVELICQQFGFYHASVFIIEPGTTQAMLYESSSEAGRLLKRHQYQLEVGSKSLVGAVTASRRPRIVQDISLDAEYQRNSLLPYTRAEAVIPLLSGEIVIGALDVQSAQVNAFTPDVVELLTTLADQIAVAVQNARLYARQKEMTARLTQTDRLKTEFLTIMSHELRTPLNSIIGFSQVILEGIDGPLTDLQRTDLSSIHISAQHLLNLINDILDLSKLMAGEAELHLQEIDLRDTIQTMVTAAQGLINDKPLVIQPDLPAKPLRVQADEARLKQVLFNLLSNAVKFTEAGQITITASASHGFVNVNITDTGVGLPPDKLLEIFKEFTQVDSSTTRRFQGLGLGLPIAKRLVEMHGGRIWAACKPDRRGSIFTFTLPVVQAEFAPVKTGRQTNHHPKEIPQWHINPLSSSS